MEDFYENIIKNYQDQVISLGLIVVFIYFTHFAIRFAIKKAITKTILRGICLRIVRYIFLFVFIMLVLGVFGVDITPIIASFSILGLAISIGSQKIVEDFLSGVFLVAEDQYNIGDTISVDGFKGEVIFQGLRITKIQNYKGEILTLSNRDVVKVINYSTTHATALVEFPVSYKTDYEKVTKIVKDFLEKYENSNIKKKPVYSGISNFENNSYYLKISCVTTPGNQFGVEREIKTQLFELLQKNDIVMPSNTLSN